MNTMYTGKQLGDAIRIAIDRKLDKGVRKKDIADYFEIKEPSIADWIKKGSIQKEKLPKLWRYFSDVVGMEHWGLTAKDFECFGLVPNYQAKEPANGQYVTARSKRVKRLIEAADLMSDAGIDHLTSYALWVASQYPRAQANREN